MNRLIVFPLLAALTGCVSTQLSTPSHQPEVTIPGHTSEEVKTAVVNHYLNQQFQVKSSDNLNVVMEKEASIMASVLLADSASPVTYTRLIVTLLAQPDGAIRLIVVPHLVSRRNDLVLDGKGFRQAQGDLDRIAEKLKK